MSETVKTVTHRLDRLLDSLAEAGYRPASLVLSRGDAEILRSAPPVGGGRFSRGRDGIETYRRIPAATLNVASSFFVTVRSVERRRTPPKGAELDRWVS